MSKREKSAYFRHVFAIYFCVCIFPKLFQRIHNQREILRRVCITKLLKSLYPAVHLFSYIRQQDSLDLCICCIYIPAVQQPAHVNVLHQLPVVVVVVVAMVDGGAAGHQDPMDGGGGKDGAKDGARHHVRGMVLVVRDAADGREDGVQDTKHLEEGYQCTRQLPYHKGNGKSDFPVFI